MSRPEYELLARLRAAAPAPPATHLRLIQEEDAEGASAHQSDPPELRIEIKCHP